MRKGRRHLELAAAGLMGVLLLGSASFADTPTAPMQCFLRITNKNFVTENHLQLPTDMNAPIPADPNRVADAPAVFSSPFTGVGGDFSKGAVSNEYPAVNGLSGWKVTASILRDENGQIAGIDLSSDGANIEKISTAIGPAHGSLTATTQQGRLQAWVYCK